MIASESKTALIDYALSKMVIGNLTPPREMSDTLAILAADLVRAKGGPAILGGNPLGEQDDSHWFAASVGGSPWLVNLIPGQQVSMISCEALAGKTLMQSIAITEGGNSESYFQAALR